MTTLAGSVTSEASMAGGAGMAGGTGMTGETSMTMTHLNAREGGRVPAVVCLSLANGKG